LTLSQHRQTAQRNIRHPGKGRDLIIATFIDVEIPAVAGTTKKITDR
jgi:hypothetical protein